MPQVYARSRDARSPYSLETEVQPLLPEILAAAGGLGGCAAAGFLAPLKELQAGLAARLDDEAEELASDARRRIDGLCRGLEWRAGRQVAAWCDMLQCLASETPAAFVDWFAVERQDGRDRDVGMYRHWIDPTQPFAEAIAAPAQGVVITSATLTDGAGDPETDWQGAELRSGANHLPGRAIRAQIRSPFDYAAQTRVLVVTDVRKDDLNQVAAAYRELFLGGRRAGRWASSPPSRACARSMAVSAPRWKGRGSTSTPSMWMPWIPQPWSIFFAPRQTPACSVPMRCATASMCRAGRCGSSSSTGSPGRGPTCAIRRAAPASTSAPTTTAWPRLKLRQAYGRLIRRKDDRGVFILLDPMMPSRLAGAFPEGVELQRVGLAEAVAQVKGFLG